MDKLKVKGSWTQFVEPLRNLESFDTHGSLRGCRGGIHTTGRLPAEYSFSVRQAEVDYVVYSWDTPIAWHNSAMGWIVPDEKYSKSTTTQQGRIRTALSQLN